jgi:Fe-S-cluster containining protein
MSLPLITPDPPCNQCQAACCHQSFDHPFAVLLREDEHDQFPEAVITDLGEGSGPVWRALPYVDGKCIHLGGDNRCQIYDRRPQGCRDFNCLFSYRLRQKYHGFFLEDRPELVAVIEATYPQWTEARKAEQPRRPDC